MMDSSTHDDSKGSNSCEGVIDVSVKELSNTYQETTFGNGRGYLSNTYQETPLSSGRGYLSNAYQATPLGSGRDYLSNMYRAAPFGSGRGYLSNTYQETPFGSERSYLNKGKEKANDMLPPLPPNAKRFRPTFPVDFTEGSAPQTMVGVNQLVHKNTSYGPASSQCDEVEDVSTESDESPDESNDEEIPEVTRDFIRSVEGHDKSSSSNDCSVDFLASKGNKVEACRNLIEEQHDDIGLGACSCSFCLKAGHMLTGLILQDTRGRLSELQKSKKRAKDCITKVNKDLSKVPKSFQELQKSKKQTKECITKVSKDLSKVPESSKLETDLLQHWKTLIQHTHDGLDQEITRTKSDLEVQSKMNEKCKKDLEEKK